MLHQLVCSSFILRQRQMLQRCSRSPGHYQRSSTSRRSDMGLSWQRRSVFCLHDRHLRVRIIPAATASTAATTPLALERTRSDVAMGQPANASRKKQLLSSPQWGASTFEACRYLSTRSMPRIPKQQQHPQRHPISRCFASSSYSFKGEKLRVAIVGGGCAGLSTALHLAPLVEQGLIAGPIDIFDGPPSNIGSNNSSGGSSSPLRDIGVGIWSTALDPFRQSKRASHELVAQDLVAAGTWLHQVGYRTMDGTWLMKSVLGSSTAAQSSNNKASNDNSNRNDMPGLLFLREKDLMAALRKAVHWEELHGKTIRLWQNSLSVAGLYEESHQPWSTNLVLSNISSHASGSSATFSSSSTSTSSHPPPPQLSERDYHLIIAADGTHSVLRHLYGGHSEVIERRLTGTSALPSPIELPSAAAGSSAYDSPVTARDWDQAQHDEAVGVQDRNYLVFRGNSRAKRRPKPNDVCFQTWGIRNSMRFATVAMKCPSSSSTTASAVNTTANSNNSNTSATENDDNEKQVWFITTDNEAIAHEADPVRRRDLLLADFADWHDPIRDIVLSTPADEILMERAIAHRHCMGPVLSFNSKVVPHLRGRRPPSSGEGPCLVFIGDAFMTVDPILAQGFTCAMEGAAALRTSLETSGLVVSSSTETDDKSSGTNTSVSLDPQQQLRDPPLAFDPIQLRVALQARQALRMERLICLLRATELVQALGQPSGSSTTLSNIVHTKVLRPLMMLTPNFIKAPIFDAVLRYSLGLGLFPKRGAKK